MKFSQKYNNIICFLSTYPPRECGIATFTQDLADALNKKFNPVVKSKICALNDSPTSIYNYSGDVAREISASELENYAMLAHEINSEKSIKVVNIQHEFGIFGGFWGDYLIPFLQVIRKPVITTFHSVLPNPEEHLKKVVMFIADKSKKIVVMNESSKEILEKDYRVRPGKIAYIAHGIPAVPFESSRDSKERLGFGDKIVLSTFGLINPDKGIEYALRALPGVIRVFPNILYLIIGATHPVVRKQEGEAYRNFLISEVERLNLQNNVKFYNKYIPLEEIVVFLKATDVYVSPVLGAGQSVSGTLSYALGCGRPVISTPTQYAKHIISEKNGMLVRFRNASDISRSLKKLLGDERLIKQMSEHAYETTRTMTWPNVAEAYHKIYSTHADLGVEENKLPKIKFDHIFRMTDEIGIHHFAKYTTPQKRFGYSLDDNARALILSAIEYERTASASMLAIMEIYLRFMKFTQRRDGSFANIVSAHKKRDDTREEDVQGRAIWALCYIMSREDLPKHIRKGAGNLFAKSQNYLKDLRAPRAVAFVMKGLYHHLKINNDARRLRNIFENDAEYLASCFKSNSSRDWEWFEDSLTYSNSTLSEVLYLAYDITKKKKYLNVAETTLKFLCSITFKKNYYIPIGQNGWYVKNKNRAYFDQQPEDTAAMVLTKIAAYKITKQRHHLNDAFTAMKWFLGKNHLGIMMYDEGSGGCHDGLGKDTINANEGAESSISYLLARLAFEAPIIQQNQKSHGHS